MTDVEIADQMRTLAQIAIEEEVDVSITDSFLRIAWCLERAGGTPEGRTIARQKLRYMTNVIGVGFACYDEARAYIQLAVEVFEHKYGSIKNENIL